MFQTISNIIRVGDIRRKVVFTLLMLIVFRIGSFIPIPGSNSDVLNFVDQANAFGFLNTFGGGALGNFSIFAMGIMPYITASIVVQLLQMDVVPKFAEWAKQGEAGRRKLTQFTRYGTIVLGFIQALGMSVGFNAMFPGLIPNPSIPMYIFIALVLTAGTAFLMWLGEQITAYGVGNGISILIFAGIAAGIPNAVNQIYALQIENAGDQLFLSIVTVLLLLLAILAITVGVIFIQQALRKIPVQYAKRLAGRSPVGGQSTHLPIKVNAAGVIPVIFALSLFMFPPVVAGFFGRDNAVSNWIITYFDYTNPVGMIVYAALIIGFTYFYTFVQVNPEQMAENLKKQGGYIPGIRPGKSTQTYLTRILYRLTFVGAIFLAVVAILPVFFTKLLGLPQAIQIGGTGLLIVVGVALDTMKRIESQLIKRSYKGFIK
ncbi:preprotein translocase subunit SecY [Alkalihalobacillus alcalophilus ATCC 27647 = CGMCC 1.3604]|uniref:Protein translocase subunit SecY n=1 Tax=Alkalihalobacillus alcalophilus ATCC 27647 = CGMCC 1.3604 TaxID=1218173 RepID=A0A094WN91_ALKAL|nr:preprotein translocase subunit SecY [Alkalihalobacillus alcalophilus]KGA98296.1 preprotein translocase subunit SecY [Alkalihalobacillus alcalophilus ATCC 27647 = CGMCC 1.3604]MED1561614.1 preprotein translocase subunit SecY [Alkalihalobacillus alcalophilus]THG89892.1 preprotein translocase subunit SecY [Alkalihalobacillus alcalophilus ATCC 27647 = CGMCC 1.3604]